MLFIVPEQDGLIFTADVEYDDPEPPGGYLEGCGELGIPRGWALRALSAGEDTPDSARAWVLEQIQNPPSSGCRMTVKQPVEPGGMASTTLSNGECVYAKLDGGAAAGQVRCAPPSRRREAPLCRAPSGRATRVRSPAQDLLFVLPPINRDGEREVRTTSAASTGRRPRLASRPRAMCALAAAALPPQHHHATVAR